MLSSLGTSDPDNFAQSHVCSSPHCRCQWVNSLWPSVAIWRHRSGSALVQVMACCRTAPSHYLNLCWLIIGKVPWHSSDGIILRKPEDINQYKKNENYIFKIASRSPRGQWVTCNSLVGASNGESYPVHIRPCPVSRPAVIIVCHAPECTTQDDIWGCPADLRFHYERTADHVGDL